MLINAEGIVLRQINFNESDKILTIFSKENGKIQAIAKGARRPKSNLLSSTQTFTYGEYTFYKGRNFYHINQGDVIQSFYSIREDLNKLAYGTYLIELVDAGIVEEEANEKLFQLLIKSLSTLIDMNKDFLKLVIAFELKYASFIGYRPQLKKCIVCNSELSEKIKFNIKFGGVQCEDCFNKDIYSYNINKEILEDMNNLLFVRLENLEGLNIDSDNMIKIHELMVKYILAHLDKNKFKSLEFIKLIK